MRALTTFAILGAVLIASASPAEAGRGTHGGTTVRIVVGSRHHFRNNVFRFSRFGFVPFTPGFFNGFDRFGFSRFAQTGRFGQFGTFDGFGESGDGGSGFGGYGFGDYGYASPTVADAPPAVPQPTLQPAPPPARFAADLPPCHEVTPSGVTIDRGTGCSRAPQ
jgi:hypothetical protein